VKHLVTADTHLDRKNGNILEIDITSEFFQWVINVSKERSVYSLIHLGDFFHNRRSVSIPALCKGKEIAFQLKNQFVDGVSIVKGNHDIYYKNLLKPSSIDFMKNLGINVVENVSLSESQNILLVPWLVDSDMIETLVGNKYNVKYAMGHLPINEIVINSSRITSKNEILDISELSKYELVLSGHFHQYGKYKNIIYIGAPYHMDFSDFGERGIYLFDDETGDIEFIEYTNAPKYFVIDAEDMDHNKIKGNNIRLEFYNNIGINKINDIINYVESLEPNSINVAYKFTPSFTNDENFDNLTEIAGNKEILVDYINKSERPQNIRMGLIEKIIDNLESEI